MPRQVFSDTSDLLAISSIKDDDVFDQSVSPTSLFDEDRESFRAWQEESRYREWVREARQLASAGVRPAPSHREDTSGRMSLSWWAGFYNAQELPLELGGSVCDPLVLFGFLVERSIEDSSLLPDQTDDDDQLGLSTSMYRRLQLPYLPNGFDWLAVAHQTAGVACNQRYLVGIPLRLTESGALMAHRLATFQQSPHVCVGASSQKLSDLAEYHRLVSSLGLSAERCFKRLEEGIYPIDAEYAPLFSATPVPTEEELTPPLDEDSESASAFDRLASLLARFASPGATYPALWVLGENCD
jgi:hypothetical protein